MTKRIRRPDFLVTLLAMVLTCPALALEAGAWRHQQTLAIPQGGITKVVVPPETLSASRPDYSDLRLVDAAGQEVPYVLEIPAAEVQPTRISPRHFAVSLRPGATEVRLETGTSVVLSGVILETPAKEFLKAARVEIGDGKGEWRPLREGAPLFRQSGAQQLHLELGDAAPWLRITIDDTGSRPVPFTAATLLAAPRVVPPPTLPLSGVTLGSRIESGDETVLTLDLGGRHLPLAHVELETPERVFTRRVTVAARTLRHEELTEQELAAGTVYRLALDGRPPEADTTIPAAFTTPARELVLRIANGDSPPLELTAVRVFQRPVSLAFAAPAAGEYRLLSGNPRAPAPRYDAGRLAEGLAGLKAVTGTLGPLSPNPGYTAQDDLEPGPLLGAEIDVSRWTHARAVQLGGTGVHFVELDFHALSHFANQGADLRLVRDGRQVPYVIERPNLFRELALGVAVDAEHSRAGHSRWRLALPAAHLPLTRLTLQTGSGIFQRRLTISEPSTGPRPREEYRQIASVDWHRGPGEPDTLSVPLDLRTASDHLQLDTDNGDNPPWVLTSARAAHPVMRLVFRAEPGELTLHYGNPRALPARYDVTLVADQLLNAERHVARLAPPLDRPRGVWSELLAGKLSLLFWGVLGVVTIALLVIVAKLLPKQNP